MAEITRFFYEKFIEPRSKGEDLKRREFIVNILLMSVVLLFGTGFVLVLYREIFASATSTFSPLDFFIVFLIFLALNFISRAGHFIFSAYVLIGTLFFLTIYAAYSWGIEVPSAQLFYVMLIVMSGVLISTRFLFVVTIICSLSTVVLAYLQRHNLIHPDLEWKMKLIKYTDTVGFIIIFLVIAVISWLSNRETEKSLARARRSEAALKKERDLLEIKVEERTKELKESQMEKIAQLSRFAEFGRLSSGLFHDLVNPLTAVSLNMEKIKDEQGNGEGIINAKSYLNKAIQATKKMEEFISAVRKQMSHQENMITFSPEDEINQIINILSHKTRKAGVNIKFLASHSIKTFGDIVKFDQVVANLVTNAIDAYEGVNNEKPKEVEINLTEENGMICLRVIDSGKGISEENITKIFDSFFTTKGFYEGVGIGLSLTKSIVEKDFRGTVIVESSEGKGAKFIIKFPIKQNE